jgi:hypothetical protein
MVFADINILATLAAVVTGSLAYMSIYRAINPISVRESGNAARITGRSMEFVGGTPAKKGNVSLQTQ